MAGLLITILRKVYQWKKIKICEYLAKLQARAWLSHALCAPGQHTAKRRRKCTRQSRSCLQICQIFTCSCLYVYSCVWSTCSYMKNVSYSDHKHRPTHFLQFVYLVFLWSLKRSFCIDRMSHTNGLDLSSVILCYYQLQWLLQHNFHLYINIRHT